MARTGQVPRGFRASPPDDSGFDLEVDLHMEVAGFLDSCLGEGTFWHHSPNEGRHHVNWRAKLAKMGVRGGFPDIIVLHRGMAFLIELKSRTGRPSPKQSEVMAQLERAGCPVGMARTVSQVAELLEKWNVPLRMNLREYAGHSRVTAEAARVLLQQTARKKRVLRSLASNSLKKC